MLNSKHIFSIRSISIFKSLARSIIRLKIIEFSIFSSFIIVNSFICCIISLVATASCAKDSNFLVCNISKFINFLSFSSFSISISLVSSDIVDCNFTISEALFLSFSFEILNFSINDSVNAVCSNFSCTKVTVFFTFAFSFSNIIFWSSNISFWSFASLSWECKVVKTSS